MNELIERFDLKQVHKSGAVFDTERLNFFNSHYLKTLDTDYLYDKLIIYLSKYDKDFLEQIQDFPEEYNKKILNELKTKIKKFDEFKNASKVFYTENINLPTEELMLNQKMKIIDLEQVKKGLEIALKIVNNNSNFKDIESVKNIFIEEIKQAEMKNGQVLWPVRCALS
jgi:glutamyl/glutaminyl-tRNA synthetase